MVAQKHKKHFLRNLFAFLNACYLKTQLIKALNFLDSSRPCRRLLENPKPGAFKELFLPENDFETCSTTNFPKNHPDFGGLKPT